MSERSDEALILAAHAEPEAFAAFYRRHARDLLAYFWRRVSDPEIAADLTAETFAAALAGVGRFDPAKGAAVAWLYGIANHQLLALRRRGAVEERARRRMGMERIAPDDSELERLEDNARTDGPHARVLHDPEDLPADQRAAVQARVVAEREYEEIAAATGSTPAAVRQRVSRGLRSLRRTITRGGGAPRGDRADGDGRPAPRVGDPDRPVEPTVAARHPGRRAQREHAARRRTCPG